MTNTISATALTATALAAGVLGLAAPALAAPAGTGSAQDTISSLQDQGYQVIVNRQSDTPLSEASVVSVGEGATFSHTNTNNGNEGGYGPNADNQFAPQNTQTVYVNVR
ncbi:MAG: hypothetical protein ABWY45_15095 [Mycobacterium sp.]